MRRQSWSRKAGSSHRRTSNSLYHKWTLNNCSSRRSCNHHIQKQIFFKHEKSIFYRGNLKEVVSIECLDANGSSKSVVTDKAGKVIKTEVWKRDDKISGRQFVDAFPHQWIHNRIEYTVTNADGTLDPSSNKDENRVYNAQGYTSSVTTRYADGRVSNFRYEYECQ